MLFRSQVTFLGPLSPLTAAVVGWAALGQSLTPVQLAGMALAFGATVAGQLGARPTADRSFGPAESNRREADLAGPVPRWQGGEGAGSAAGRGCGPLPAGRSASLEATVEGLRQT